MADMTTAWDAWTNLHRAHGFEIANFLHKPATDMELDAVEVEIGYRLPDDLRALWRIADGQLDSYEVASTQPETVISPMFGSYDFITTANALTQYRIWADVLREQGNGMDYGITRRDNDPVQAAYWIPGWLPFALDGGGNCYAVDLSPAEGGSYGQVILMGPDEDERRVLGIGIASWLMDVARNAPPLNDMADRPLAYFDMEHRAA